MVRRSTSARQATRCRGASRQARRRGARLAAHRIVHVAGALAPYAVPLGAVAGGVSAGASFALGARAVLAVVFGLLAATAVVLLGSIPRRFLSWSGLARYGAILAGLDRGSIITSTRVRYPALTEALSDDAVLAAVATAIARSSGVLVEPAWPPPEDPPLVRALRAEVFCATPTRVRRAGVAGAGLTVVLGLGVFLLVLPASPLAGLGALALFAARATHQPSVLDEVELLRARFVLIAEDRLRLE